MGYIMRALFLQIVLALSCGLLIQINAQEDELTSKLLELRKFSVARDKLDSPVQKRETCERFPLGDPDVRHWLSNTFSVHRSSTNGLAAVLFAHGAEGFLWALEQMANNDSVHVRANMVLALRFFKYRETAVLYAALLDDTRPVPRPVLIPGHDWVSMNLGGGPGPGCGPERICDQAARYVLTVALSYLPRTPPALPERFKGMNPNFGPSSLTKQRDDGIAMLKAWWKEEGERLVMTTRPSFIEELLKPPDPKPEAAPDQENKEKPKEHPAKE